MQARNPNHSRGIDVSHYQGTIDWPRVKKAGISFAYVKASQGTTIVDRKFVANVRGARAAGIYTGAYHYMEASDTAQGEAEAEHFLAALGQAGGIGVLDLPPVLDVEHDSNTADAALGWISRVQKTTGNQPIVYTYPYFASSRLGGALRDLPLWYAYYSKDGHPPDRAGWTRWTFLQYSNAGRVDGINGPVDLDEFDGRLEDVFQQFFAAIDELKTEIERLRQRVATLETNERMSEIPDWAREAVDAAVAAGLVHEPNGGSYDFYRLLTVLHRKGAL